MKKLLLILLANAFISNGQGNSCATATLISNNGTYSCPAINSGTYVQSCFSAVAGIHSKWYKFIPNENGVVLITSNIDDNQNQDLDTRLSVMKGNCNSLICFAGNDNFLPNVFDAKLSFVEFAVEANTTYFFQWDSRWDSRGFQFEYTFTPTSCLPINQLGMYRQLSSTSNSVDIKWDNAIGHPENYIIDWHEQFDIQFSNTNQSIFSTDNGNYSIKTIENIASGSNITYFIASQCGTNPNIGSSIRKGPFFGFTAKDLPYSLNFDVDFPQNVFTDGFVGFDTFFTDNSTQPSNYADGGEGRAAFTFNSTEEFSNLWGFTRGINLTQGQTVNLTFKSRLFSFSGTSSPMSISLYAGLSQNQSTQTNLIESYSLTNSTNYTSHSATFTAPTTDVYYFGFQNNSFPGTTQTFAFLDTITITPALANEEFASNPLHFSPNPVGDKIEFTNTLIEIDKADIIDSTGRLIKTIFPENELNSIFDVSFLKKGIYFLVVSSSTYQSTLKLIKN